MYKMKVINGRRDGMRTKEMFLDQRINRFINRKLKKHPEVWRSEGKKINVYQSGNVLDEVNYFFDTMKRI